MVTGPAAGAILPIDAFDLPDWLGEDEVTWTSAAGLRGGLSRGRLSGGGAGGGSGLDCDLLACDLAYPTPQIDEEWRRAAHSSWALGQVLLVEMHGRLTLVAPGVEVSVDLALESLRRLAKAVGVRPERFTVALRL